jgi:hypothetical protein
MAPDGQIGQAYQILSETMPELTAWQAAGKVGAILVTDKDQQDSLSLGGYKISLVQPARRGPAPPPAAAAGPAASGPPRNPAIDTRPFAIVVNTAPNEFLLIGANGAPKFSADSPGPTQVAIASKEEGRYEQGKWIRGRRLNGDQITAGLPANRIGLMKVNLLRFD